jgi:hypothetical protein
VFRGGFRRAVTKQPAFSGRNERGDVAGSWKRRAAERDATRRSATSSTTLNTYRPSGLRVGGTYVCIWRTGFFSLSSHRGRRGLGRGGPSRLKVRRCVSGWIPLSPALSPFVPHGERECRSRAQRIPTFQSRHRHWKVPGTRGQECPRYGDFGCWVQPHARFAAQPLRVVLGGHTRAPRFESRTIELFSNPFKNL